jgi:transposase
MAKLICRNKRGERLSKSDENLNRKLRFKTSQSPPPPLRLRPASERKRELPESLPRERIEYDLESPCCPSCAKEMPVIGEELSEELEFIPASFKVIEHVRLKRACGSCKNGVYVPSLPPEVKPLERRQAGAGLLSQILLSKYQDHQPLYRQEQIFKRHGINLTRRLMCGRGTRLDLIQGLMPPLRA